MAGKIRVFVSPNDQSQFIPAPSFCPWAVEAVIRTWSCLMYLKCHNRRFSGELILQAGMSLLPCDEPSTLTAWLSTLLANKSVGPLFALILPRTWNQYLLNAAGKAGYLGKGLLFDPPECHSYQILHDWLRVWVRGVVIEPGETLVCVVRAEEG